MPQPPQAQRVVPCETEPDAWPAEMAVAAAWAAVDLAALVEPVGADVPAVKAAAAVHQACSALLDAAEADTQVAAGRTRTAERLPLAQRVWHQRWGLLRLAWAAPLARRDVSLASAVVEVEEVVRAPRYAAEALAERIGLGRQPRFPVMPSSRKLRRRQSFPRSSPVQALAAVGEPRPSLRPPMPPRRLRRQAVWRLLLVRIPRESRAESS